MTERTSSLIILLGGTLAVIVLWALSVLAVRWDTRRRRVPELERKTWLALSIVLPLFGFAFYLAMLVYRAYLSPRTPRVDPLDEARITSVKARAQVGWGQPGAGEPSSEYPGSSPEPAWGPDPKAGSNGQSRQTPMTVPAQFQPRGQAGEGARLALVVLQGPHLGQNFLVSRLPARIGRGPEANIPLDADLNVSRKHAEIYEWNGVLRIRDLQSSHGTLVNNVRITDHALSPGDRLTIGGSVLILREAS